MIHLNQNLGEITSALAQWLWQWSWQTSVVIGLVLLLRVAAFRGGLLRWRSALWLIVLVKMVMPFDFSSGVSIFNLARWPMSKIHSSLATTPMSAQPGTLASAPKRSVAIHYGAPPPDLASPAFEASPQPAPLRSLSRALVSIWFLGTAVLLIGTVWSQVRFVRRLRSFSVTKDAHLLAALQDGIEWLGVEHGPPIILTDAVSAPAIVGVIKPRLLLPFDTAASLTPTQLRNVLLHELAHLKRHDLQIDVLCIVVRALQWFNPLVWLSLALYRSDREIARDAMVLRHAPTPVAKDYGNTIIALIERIAGNVTLPAGSLGILESHRNVRQRVLAVTEQRFRRIGWIRAAVALLLVLSLGAAALTGCRKDEPQSAKNNVSHTSGVAFKEELNADSAARTALQRHINEITIDAYTLTEAVEQLSAKTGETIVIEAAAVNVAQMRHYEFKAKNSTLEKVLWLILSDAGGEQVRLNFAIIHGTITVSTDDALKRASAETRVYDIRDLLVDIPDFTDAPSFFNNTPATKLAESGNDEKQMTTEEKVQAVEKLIKETVDPTSWDQFAAIHASSRELVVYQTPENHQALSKLLEKLRESRGIEITVEARIINVDADALNDPAKLGGIKVLQFGGDSKLPATYLDGQQTTALLDALKASGASSNVSAPRMTLFNGQRAYVLEREGEKYVSDFKPVHKSSGETFEPVMSDVPTGTLLDFQATVSSDRHYVTLTLRPQISHLEGYDHLRWKGSPEGRNDLQVQVPKVSRMSVNTTVSVPNQGTLLIQLSPASDPSTNPSNGRHHEIRTLLLVRPTIIIQREASKRKE